MSTTRPRMSLATARELADAYPHKSNPDLAAEFGVSLRSVEMFGYRHGLKKLPAVRQLGRVQAREQRRTEEAKRRDAFILLHIRTMTAVQMAEALGCRDRLIRQRCDALGVECIRAPKGPAKAGAAPRKEPVQIVVPAGVVVQRAPAIRYDVRYQCHPAEQVPRLFSMVPVGVNPMTGRDWGVSL
jgi:hypothetical protein